MREPPRISSVRDLPGEAGTRVPRAKEHLGNDLGIACGELSVVSQGSSRVPSLAGSDRTEGGEEKSLGVVYSADVYFGRRIPVSKGRRAGRTIGFACTSSKKTKSSTLPRVQRFKVIISLRRPKRGLPSPDSGRNNRAKFLSVVMKVLHLTGSQRSEQPLD